MEAGRRLHLTNYELEKPHAPPAFCMALRKYLRGAWLINVEQYEFERIVTFYFKTKTGMLRLILELFGEGITICGAELIQITWKNHLGFVYDKETLDLIREFSFSTEGWGITYDASD
jgi:glutamine cyclotransferase